MQWMIEAAPKNDKGNSSFYVVFSEKEKKLGQVPGANPTFMAQVQNVLKAQTQKSLTGAFELLQNGEGKVGIAQLPQRKGLDRLDNIRVAATALLDLAKSRSLTAITVCMDQTGQDEIRAFLEGLSLASYEFRKYKSETESEKKSLVIHILVSRQQKVAATRISNEVQSLRSRWNLCRDLINETGSELIPATFAEKARKAAKDAGLNVQVLDEKALQKEGFTGLWTVGKGSDHAPRMVVIQYDGAKKQKKQRHLVLVGKGVTFDTGGISLKPSAGMWEMKCDMSGAATALSALLAIADLKLPIKVSAVLCMAENRPGNAAVLPGDIFRAKNGKTIMVDNTDAEGRLILTDGLAKAGELGATHIVDLATLTGAIVRAVGPSIAGVFSNDENFATTLVSLGKSVGEKFCAFPLEMEYREWLEDPVADMRNVGKAEAGAITAALFLNEFVPEKTVWAHLDIAGTAFTTSNWKYYKPGGTAWGMKTLIALAKELG